MPRRTKAVIPVEPLSLQGNPLAGLTLSAGSVEPPGCVALFHHDYVTGHSGVEEAQPGSPAPDELVQVLRAAHPSLEKISATDKGKCSNRAWPDG